MSIEDRLQELGIILPQPAKPAGSYKPCVMVDNTAYISGQGPLLEDGSFAKGVSSAQIKITMADLFKNCNWSNFVTNLTTKLLRTLIVCLFSRRKKFLRCGLHRFLYHA